MKYDFMNYTMSRNTPDSKTYHAIRYELYRLVNFELEIEIL